MIKCIFIIFINDKIKMNIIFLLFMIYQGKFLKKNDVKYFVSFCENCGFFSSNKLC